MAQTPAAAQDASDKRDLLLRNELLSVVLRHTVKHTGVPPQWIGGEVTPLTDPDGSITHEVRLVIECDEPRFLYYLSKFQSEFEARLLAVDPKAWDWVSRISWSLGSQRDDNPDFKLPPADYWDEVLVDRDLTARKQGRTAWKPEDLARHFDNTQPGMKADFEDTAPPERGIEDMLRPAGKD